MLCSLLLTGDENAARVISRVFKDLEVDCNHLSDSAAALEAISKRRFDAVVIDDCVDQAAAVLAKLLEAPGYSKSVRIVLADPQSSTSVGFKGTSQIMLYKPLSAERVRHGLRAVRNLMARDRRRGMKRVATMIRARLRHGRASSGQVFISDISDSGAAIQCSDGALPTGNLHLDFSLPDDPDHIHITAELVWQDNQGAAGIHFRDMASCARKRLSQWIKDEAAKGSRFSFAKSLGI